jgi:hypothetical protein
MQTECNAVFLFVAELTGSFISGSGNVDTKIGCGQQDYINNVFLELDLDCEEARKSLHENIWLERLYKELDQYFMLPVGSDDERLTAVMSGRYREDSYKWTVPIEIDATSSMCQIIGTLLNDKRLLEMTNVIGDTLEDAWKIEGVSRKKVKCAMTPKLYGSSQSVQSLWTKHHMTHTAEEISIINNELQTGAFGIANAFKDFVINNCTPKTDMDIKIGEDEFSVRCNKFRNVGENTKAYKIWDSLDKRYNIVLRMETSQVPDLEQFRLYTQTLLIHNLDSQIMDNVCNKVMNKYGWGIPVHDAILISPAAAADTRQWYAEELESIHKNRKSILQGYFRSIGITAATEAEWECLQGKIHNLEGELVANHMALK